MYDRLLILVFLTVVASCGYARANSLLVSDNQGWLWGVNVENGESRKLFRTAAVMSDIASLPIGFDGELYGLHFEGDSDALYRIDMVAEETTFIAEVGMSEYGPLFNTQKPNALTFDHEGRLLVSTFNSVTFSGGVFTNPEGKLGTIDPVTGFPELVGVIGYGSAGGLAASPDRLYMSSCKQSGLFLNCSTSSANHLIAIDLETGVGTDLGSTGFANITALEVVGEKLVGFTGNGQILDIDPVTARTRLMARTSPLIRVTGATHFPRGAYELRLIPEPNSIILLLVGLVTLLNWRRRNSRSQKSA